MTNPTAKKCYVHDWNYTTKNCQHCVQDAAARRERIEPSEVWWGASDAVGQTAPLIAGTGLHPEPALTGGSTDYYKVRVERPTSGGDKYTAECNDIIEALQMEYDVANAFKAAWRVAALRQGRGKPGQDSAVYDGEKIVFFGQRIIAREKAK